MRADQLAIELRQRGIGLHHFVGELQKCAKNVRTSRSDCAHSALCNIIKLRVHC